MTSVSGVSSPVFLTLPTAPSQSKDRLSSLILSMKSLLGVAGGSLLHDHDLKTMLISVKDRVALEKEEMKALIDLLDGLYDETRSDEELIELFSLCPQKESLSNLIAMADGVNSSALEYGEMKIRANPRNILQAISLVKKEDLGDSLSGIVKVFETYQETASGVFLQPIIISGSEEQLKQVLSVHSFSEDALNGAFKLACERSIKEAKIGSEGEKMVQLLLRDERSKRVMNFKSALQTASDLSDRRVIQLVSGEFRLPFDPLLLLKEECSISQEVLDKAFESAVLNGRSEIIKVLLGDGRMISTDKLDKAIELAIILNHPYVVKILLSDGGTIRQETLDKAFRNAVLSCRLEIMNLLLGCRHAINETQFNKVLEHTIAFNHVDALKVLLKNRHKINQDVLEKNFVNAVSKGHVEMVKVLLSDGRTIRQDVLEKTFVSAASQGHVEVVKVLLSDGRTIRQDILEKTFVSAASQGHVEIVKFLLSDGGTIRQDVLEKTFVSAASQGHVEVVKAIFSEGPRIHQDILEKTFANAVLKGHVGLVKAILSEGHRFNKTVLSLAIHSAFEKLDVDIIEFLFEHQDIQNHKELVKYLKEIKKEIQSTLQRAFIFNRLETIFFDDPDLFSKIISEVKKLSPTNSRIQVAALILMLYSKEFQKENVPSLNILEKLSKYKEFLKGSEYVRPLFTCLYMLSSLELDKKNEILLALFDETLSISKATNNLRELLSSMSSLMNLSCTDWVDEFLSQKTAEEKKIYLVEKFKQYIQEAYIFFLEESFTEEELLRLVSQRDPAALFVYKGIVSEFKSELSPFYDRFLLSIMKGNFPKLRYEDLSSPHIEKLKEEFHEIWNRWKTKVIEDANISTFGKSSAPLNFLDYVKEKFREGHHLLESGAQHPLLSEFTTFLEATKEEQQALYLEITDAPSGPMTIVQKALMELILKKSPDFLESIKAICKQFDGQQGCPLLHDLKEFEKSSSHKEQTSNYFVTNTDDWQDLFHSGTEVIGSCQSVYAESWTNRCLLAYPLDAKNRMIAVKSKLTNKIQARAIFRILFKDSKPALFIDKIYSSLPKCPELYSQAIFDHAKEVSKSLGLDLYVESFSGTSRLKSLGSSVAHEFADAAKGETITNGVYTIEKADKV